MVKYKYNGDVFTLASDNGTQVAGEDFYELRELCGNVVHPKAISVLQDWYDTANVHDQKQFNQLFGELSEYKRDHYDEVVARSGSVISMRTNRSGRSHSSVSRLSALSQRSVRSEKKEVTAEDRKQRAISFLDQATHKHLVARSIADGPNSVTADAPASSPATDTPPRTPLKPSPQLSLIDSMRRKQMLSMIPTSYSREYRPWGISPRVSELLGAHKAKPLLDPFSSILSLTPEERERLAKMPMKQSSYTNDYKAQSPAEIFVKFCELFLTETSFDVVQQWFTEVDDLRRSRLIQVARLLLRPNKRILAPGSRGSSSMRSPMKRSQSAPRPRSAQTPMSTTHSIALHGEVATLETDVQFGDGDVSTFSISGNTDRAVSPMRESVTPTPSRDLVASSPMRPMTSLSSYGGTSTPVLDRPRPPSMMTHYQREYGAKYVEKPARGEKTDKPELEVPYARSFVSSDIAAQSNTAYRSEFTHTRAQAAKDISGDRMIARKMLDWVQQGTSVWGKAFTESPVPLETGTHYRETFLHPDPERVLPEIRSSPVKKLQDKWDLGIMP